jgi:Protein of unknown function (DUF2877)
MSHGGAVENGPLGASSEEPIAILRWSAATRHRVLCAPPEAGRVHSVFRRAVNILWHDGRLLALQGPAPLAVPCGLVLSRLPSGESPGTRVRRGDGRILCGAESLVWEGASLTDPTIHPAGETREMLEAVLNEPTGARVAPGLDSEVGRRGQQLMAQGIGSGNAATVLEGARRLIGMGEGLTPAGDDCLVGALAMLHRFRRPWLEGQPEVTAAIAAAVEEGTTLVAREFILHALGGSFSEAILRLVGAASEQEARLAVAQVLATGGTSGADILRGMRLALEAIRG